MKAGNVFLKNGRVQYIGVAGERKKWPLMLP